MNSTSGAWQLATSVSRELRVEPGGSTGLYVWLSFSFLLVVVFLVLALSFARHTRRVLRRRRVLLDYAEANITIIRPRIHRMFTSRAGSRVTAWPDLTPRSGVEADSWSDSIADDQRGGTIDQWTSTQGSRCSSPCLSQGSVDRDWSAASRIFWTDWSDCSALSGDKFETQVGLQRGVPPFSLGGHAGRIRTGDPGLEERHRATCSHMTFCVHEDLPGGDVMRVLSPSAPLLQELSSTSLSSTSHVEDWSRDCSITATRPLGSTTIGWSPNNSADSSLTVNVTPIRPFGTSHYHLERHSSSDADAVSTQRESSLPFQTLFTEIDLDIHIHTASRRPVTLLLPCARARNTADVGRVTSSCNNERREGSTSSAARSCGHDVSDVYRPHHHCASDVCRTHHHDVSDVYKPHHHVYRTPSRCGDVPLTSCAASQCVKTSRLSARWRPVRHDGDRGQTRAAGCDESEALAPFREQHSTDCGGRRSGARGDVHSATRPAGTPTLRWPRWSLQPQLWSPAFASCLFSVLRPLTFVSSTMFLSFSLCLSLCVSAMNKQAEAWCSSV